jgi:hypothetical protein
MIAAIAFGALALFLVGRMFFASSETPPRRTSNSRNANARTTNPANGENGLSQIEADPTLQIQRPVSTIRSVITCPIRDAIFSLSTSRR